MSYTRVMTGSVAWYASGSVHYPASETGGSVGYSDSGTVPVTITVRVETEPFDASVAVCDAQLAALGSAVTDMKDAQCKAIQNTSDVVSSHITSGFFSLVKSELSQNMAALFSKLNSQIILIMEKTKNAVRQREIMQSDYGRALARYTKVFSGLDDECKRRVAEVDKSSYILSSAIREKTTVQSQFQASSITYMNDGTVTRSMIFCAYIKSKAGIITKDLARRVAQQYLYAAQMKGILREDIGEGREVMVPVLYMKALNIEDKEGEEEECYACGGMEKIGQDMAEAVKRYAGTADSFIAGQEERGRIRKAFNALSEQYFSKDGERESTTEASREKKKRVYETMMSLYENGGEG